MGITAAALNSPETAEHTAALVGLRLHHYYNPVSAISRMLIRDEKVHWIQWRQWRPFKDNGDAFRLLGALLEKGFSLSTTPKGVTLSSAEFGTVTATLDQAEGDQDAALRLACCLAAYKVPPSP